MVVAAQLDHAVEITLIGEQVGSQVVELRHLPPVRLGDTPARPPQRIVDLTELDHRLGDPGELVGRGEIAAQQVHEPIDVTVDDREPLGCVLGCEARKAAVEIPQQLETVIAIDCLLGAPGDLAPEHGQALLSQRTLVGDGVDLEEVLVVEGETDQPPRQLLRIGHT